MIIATITAPGTRLRLPTKNSNSARLRERRPATVLTFGPSRHRSWLSAVRIRRARSSSIPSKRKLYYVLSATSAYAYPIAVGRQGFGWTGKEKISRIADWPDWYPPADMRKRKPSLPERMLGGIRNPLGAKAIYLGNTLYRIHGTNEPKSIGKAESSGCFRMLNENVLHLASLVHVGTEVTIVRSLDGKIASAAQPQKAKGETERPDADRRSYDATTTTMMPIGMSPTIPGADRRELE